LTDCYSYDYSLRDVGLKEWAYSAIDQVHRDHISFQRPLL
jgi:hypothetical protein